MAKYEIDPSKTALLIIDMSNDFVEPKDEADFDTARAFVPTLDKLADACRSAGAQVIYFTVAWKPDGSDMGRVADTWPSMINERGEPIICIAGTRGVDIYEPLKPQAEDLLIAKQRFSCFAGTGLHEILVKSGIDTVIVTGVAANGCCESTARDAVNRDYKVIYVSDCNGTYDLPDMGWGPVSAADTMRTLLTEMAFAVGEVAPAADVIERLGVEAGTLANQ